MTNKIVSKNTAHRYNTRYQNLRKEGLKKSEITLNMLYGNKYEFKRYKWDKKKQKPEYISIDKQSDKVKDILYREQQLVKVRTATGKIRYYSPYYKKFMKPPKVPMKIKVADNVYIYLYRMDRERSQLYHVVKWELADFVMQNPQDVEEYRKNLVPIFDKIVKTYAKTLKKYPLGTWRGKPFRVHISGRIKYIFTKHGVMKTGGRTFLATRAENHSGVRKKFNHTINEIKGDFKDGYTDIAIHSIYLYLSAPFTEEARAKYGIRTGVRDI